MLKDALKAVGKSFLIVTGVSYGVMRALDVLRADRVPDPVAQPRLDAFEERLARLENSVARHAEEFVNRAELTTALDRFSGELNADIERRFDVQNRSVQSLRTMIARTDELLEQVLESIESSSVSA